jgi:hypothetical protein
VSPGVRSAISLVVGLLLPPLLVADLAKPIVLLVLAVPYAPAVAVDPASYCTATALCLASLKVRHALKIKPDVIVVVVR